MKMIGMRRLDKTSRLWRSRPLICGMTTSRIKQMTSSRGAEAKKSSAEENASALNPKDRRRFLIPSRTDLSSSMIEIREVREMVCGMSCPLILVKRLGSGMESSAVEERLPIISSYNCSTTLNQGAGVDAG